LSTPAVDPTSSTQPNEPEFYLINYELGSFSEDEDKVLQNQPTEDDKEEAKHVSLITIVPPYYIAPHMHNFKDSEYGHRLDREEVQHPIWTLFEGMCFLT